MSARVAAADLGKGSAKLLVGTLGAGGVRLESQVIAAHEGRPLEVFARWYEEHSVDRCAALAVTGLYSDEVAAPALGPLPDDACLAAALDCAPALRGSVNLVSVGARGYAALTRDDEGRVHYLQNDKCSSGTGETMVKTAARFGMTIDEADALAASTSDAIAITARCSVFAKSEMTHFGNQGEPVDRLFRGYFESIARYAAALLARVRVGGPVYLVGGASRLRTLRDCLAAQLGCDVHLHEHGVVLEAIGALALAAEHAATCHATLPAAAGHLVRKKERRIRALAPARDASHRVTRLTAAPARENAERSPCILGLDLGSTGSKAALTSGEGGELAFDLYDRTRGNPVEAAQRLVRTLLERATPDVRAIGVTGSGREAVATVLRAAFPDAADRIVVTNEIVAHATAAIRCDARGGESLSVVEIGGQDAKYIRIADGHIVESDMNKACSAGTGSFLEEQAGLYGVADIEEFARLAADARTPPDLGQMCTVFVADAAAQAHAQGFSVPDLFGGFQYSVIHNYLNRVMGQRSFGARVFFQGKPASGESLAWTLAAVSGREVVVPANPGVMGAWGIGLCAISELGKAALERVPALDLAALLRAEVVGRAELRCEDKRCMTLCRIERATVSVSGARRTVFSGGSCPKFELASASRPKLGADAPSAFDEREALLRGWLADADGERVVSVPCAGSLAGWLPWTVTFLRELGLGVRVVRSSARSLARGEELCSAYDSCAPMKIAHALTAEQAGPIFFPRLLSLIDRDGACGKTCSTEQAMPAVAAQVLRARGSKARIASPVLSFDHGFTAPSVLLAGARAAKQLGAPPGRVPTALLAAAEAQRSYERELAAIGRRTLAYGRARRLPIVVVCGSLHVVFDPAVNANIPGILRQNGALALPMDCHRVPAETDALESVAWADARRALRVALAAREAGDVYPLWLSSFGCGPSSFVEQIFGHVMHGYPHTCLESDGHGGAAGFVTRIQAFLHGVRQHDRRPSPAPAGRLRALEPIEPRRSPARRLTPPSKPEAAPRLVMFSVADGLGALAAASYRSLGYDAVCAGPNTSESLALGRRDCSGKECVPYQYMWGAFRKHLEDRPPDRPVELVQVSGQGACRNCMFSIKDRISLEHLGLDGSVGIRHFGLDNDSRTAFLGGFWAGTLGWDVLRQLASYHRGIPSIADRVDAIASRYQAALLALMERRHPRGARQLLARRRQWRDVLALVERASDEFADLAPAHRDDGRTVLLTGDIYVRIDDVANDGLVRALNRRGLRVLADPVSVMVEYLSVERSRELLGLPDGLVENAVHGLLVRSMRRQIYDVVRGRHRWLTMPDVPRMLEHARPIIDRHPLGEAPITVGSVMYAWSERACDGVVVSSPWGCGPALVAESLLRPQRDVPMLFVYSDGSPLDERQVDAFAHRLRRQPPRVTS